MEKKRPFFDPMQVATRLHEALTHDMARLSTAYGESHVSKFRANVQIGAFLKKFTVPDSDPDPILERKAYKTFVETMDRFPRSVANRSRNAKRLGIPLSPMGMYVCSKESVVGRPVLNVDNITVRDMPIVLERMRRYIFLILGDVTLEQMFLASRHSAGTTVGLSFQNTSLERKWEFPITVTRRCVPLMSEYFQWDSEMSLAAMSRNNRHGPDGRIYKVVDGSEATTVDKSTTERRMIAKEPTFNMYLQQGLMAEMYDRLKLAGVDLTELQDVHKHLAFIASITGRQATIDKSKASDTCGLGLVAEVFPASWLEFMLDTRSNNLRIPVKGQKECWVSLPVYSTMGNATTFPVETLLFLSLANALADLSSRKMPMCRLDLPELRSNISVYGDDCIMPGDLYPLYAKAAKWLDFQINHEKSFFDAQDPFRESCGGDYLKGHDVRPLQLKGPAGTTKAHYEAWLYSVWNVVTQKYITYFGSRNYLYDSVLLGVIAGLLKDLRKPLLAVPRHFPDDAGLKIFEDYDRIIAITGFDIDTIGVTPDGDLVLRFLKFEYPEKGMADGFLRFAQWLKESAREVDDATVDTITRSVAKQVITTAIKKMGRYVVAYAVTTRAISRWLPFIGPRNP